jgi:6-phosphofructokinase 2
MAIITVTLNPALDIWATTAVLEPDRKLHCTDTELTPGGGGINVARAIHRLGGASIAIFPAGGSAGAILCDLLRAEDVSIRPVSIAAMTRQSFAIRVATSGQHYRFVLPGPTLDGHDLEACRRQLETAVHEGSIFVLSGSMPDGVGGDELTGLVALARDRGAVAVVDTSGPALTAAAAAGCYVLKPSLNELRGQSGQPLETDMEIATAARTLLQLGANHAVVVSLASRGAMLVAADSDPILVSAPRVSVVSAVGAGDSLVGAMALALEGGVPLIEAVRRGVAAGTAATLAPDHTLCHAGDVDRLIGLVGVGHLITTGCDGTGTGTFGPVDR